MAEHGTEDHLHQIARELRAFLEPVWGLWARERGREATVLSEGTCGPTCRFLIKVLSELGLDVEMLSGRPGRKPAGIQVNGAWRGHAWLRVGDRILDITADQFGLPPVLLTAVNDPRYRAGPDRTRPEFLAEEQRLATALYEQWKQRTM